MDNIIGRKLDGRYEIQEIIGVGGMAIVYKAYDSIDDRIVAVKVLKEEYLSNEDFKRRFKNESKAIAVLSHPNIVKVYDVSLGERLQYIVMEYIDGITLKEYIDQQQVLTWKEAVHFTVQILRALEHAHEKGIVHRDIKPQNIMMIEDGSIKVADFGIARFANSETRTMTDKAIGSVHYISPEQARGADTDEKSDLYSVGVMLYEMLTGQLPFESENAVSVAIMQMQQEPKRPRELNDKIPEGLEEITLRAMQKEPEQRYATAADMLSDIDEFKKNPSIHFEYKYFVDDTPTKYVDAINKVKGVPEKEPENKSKKPEKKASVIPILSGIAAAVLIFTLVIIVGVLYAMGFFTSPSGNVAAPNLIGKVYDQVVSDKSYKFTITKTNESYNDKPVGSILTQDPEAGTMVKPNTQIKVTVSLGPKLATIQNVVNEQEADAKLDLTNIGFVVTSTPEFSTTVAKGLVTRTDPAPNTQVQYGSNVTIYVSQGPEIKMTKVPNDLVGKVYLGNESNITNELQQNQLKIGNITYQWSTSVDYGKIISTSPNGDTQAQADTAVNLTVSIGVEPDNYKGNPLSFTMNKLLATSAKNLTIKITDDMGNQDISSNYSNYVNYIVTAQTDSASKREIDITVDPAVGDYKNKQLQTAVTSLRNLGYTIKVADNAGNAIDINGSLSGYTVASQSVPSGNATLKSNTITLTTNEAVKLTGPLTPPGGGT